MLGIVGTPVQFTGTSGTETLPAGAKLIALWAIGSANCTINIFGGGNIAVPNNAVFEPNLPTVQECLVAGATPTIVFTNTTTYWGIYKKVVNT